MANVDNAHGVIATDGQHYCTRCGAFGATPQLPCEPPAGGHDSRGAFTSAPVEREAATVPPAGSAK